jgi:putative Mg2+ transporter-C (MgtC) family protein
VSVGEVVLATLREEFSDLDDVAQLTRVVLRLTLALLLGAAVGYERERRQSAAGLRTHMLVALGAALFVLVPQLAQASMADLTRVLQGLVAGIGFLGAGAVLKLGAEHQIRGLTTAASVWVTAAIGITVGFGRESTAVLATALVLVILAVLPRIERRMRRGHDDADDDAASGPPEPR